MFATLASDYPVGPLPGGADDLAAVRARHADGSMDRDAYEVLVDEWVRRVVDEQIAAGLAMACDAGGRWLDGQLGLARDLLSGRVQPADVVAAWRCADEGTNVLTKQVLPGPWSASIAIGSTPDDRAGVCRDLVTILGRVGKELAAAGCPLIQFDEPVVAGSGTAGEPSARAVDDLAAGLGALLDALPEGTSVCLGLPDGAPHADLWTALAGLAFQSYLVDVTAGPDAWRFIAALPADRGVIVGAIDARSPDIDDPEMLVWAATMAAEMGDRGSSRVGVAPSGSLAALDRFRARRKIEQAGMAVRLAAMGPLGDVARALQPDPATCPIPGLPQMYREWRLATGGSTG